MNIKKSWVKYRMDLFGEAGGPGGGHVRRRAAPLLARGFLVFDLLSLICSAVLLEMFKALGKIFLVRNGAVESYRCCVVIPRRHMGLVTRQWGKVVKY